MKATLQFLAVPTVDTTGTVIEFQVENKRYIFGRIAEGTQRAFRQNGANLVKTSQCFITGPTEWNSVGGLMGLALTHCDTLASSVATTAKDAKPSSLVVRGGSGLLHSIAVGRKYSLRFGGHVQFQEFQETTAQSPKKAPDYEDTHIRVWALPIPKQPLTASLTPTKRKRSFNADSDNPSPGIGAMIKQKNHDTLVGIIDDMWQSAWRRDALVETRLGDVQTSMKKVWIRNPETKDINEYNGPLPGGTTPIPDADLKVLVRLPWPSSLIKSLPPVSVQHESMSYIVKTHPTRGKFLVDRAKELGIPKGRPFTVLAAGHSLVLADGRTITPDMVLGPERPSNGIAIIDISSADYIKGVLSRSEWNDPESMEGIEAFVWILGPGISSAPEITAFINRFANLKHFVASPDHCPNTISMKRATSLLNQLVAINSLNFKPLLSHLPFVMDDTTSPNVSPTQNHIDCAAPAALDIIVNLRPQFGVSRRSADVTVDDVPKTVLQLAENAKKINIAKESEHALWKSTIGLPDAEIVFLGTGSAIPSLTRNVTGILVRVPGYGNYILDCGENTIGQLRRMYSRDEVSSILRDLRMIWISHIHADHHLGTIGILKAWYEEVHSSKPLDPPLTGSPANVTAQIKTNIRRSHSPYLPIVANSSYLSVLDEFSAIEDIGFSRVLPIFHRPGDVNPLTVEHTRKTEMLIHASMVPKSRRGELLVTPGLHHLIFGPIELQTVHVRHCLGASAIAITFQPEDSSSKQFKIAWSGDCRPSLPLAVIGRDADVLIHEATFADDKSGQAEAKNHSTINEAILVAEAMRAKSLILTHFSQRYPKLPDLNAINVNLDANAGALATNKLMEMDLRERGGEVEKEVDQPMIEEEDIDDGFIPQINISPSGKVPEPTPKALTGSDSDNAASLRLHICPAFDYMRIKVGDIAKFEAHTPALVELFTEREKEEPKETDDSKVTLEEKTKQQKAQETRNTKQQRRKSNTEEGTAAQLNIA